MIKGAAMSIFSMFFFAGVAMAQDAEKTLCESSETIYFSCNLESSNKIVSVCASRNSDPSHGYVKYRFGNLNKIDIEYPDKDVTPINVFRMTDASEGSMNGLHLKFIKNGYTYVVSSQSPGELYVASDRGIVFDKICKAGQYKTFPEDAYKGLKWFPKTDVDDH